MQVPPHCAQQQEQKEVEHRGKRQPGGKVELVEWLID
jgi:hypothetical protein